MKGAKPASKKLRKYLAAGIALIAAVGAVVGNLNTILDFGERLASVFGQDDGAEGAPARLSFEAVSFEEPLTAGSDGFSSDDFAFRIFPYESFRYALRLILSASFKDPRFNELPFLRSLNDLEIVGLFDPAEGPPNRVTIRQESLREDSHQAALAEVLNPHLLERRDDGSIHWIIYMKLGWQPGASDEIVFRTGPREWRASFGNLEWTEFATETDGESKTWWAAQARLHLEVEDPDWVVLRSARLLPVAAKHDDGKRESLLEVIVENRSKATVPLQELLIDANQRKSFFCSIGPDYRPPPPQEVTLNWELIVSQKAPTDVEAWTTLAGKDVTVSTALQVENCFSPHTFAAALPVQADVPPGELRRLTVQLAEVPYPLDDTAALGRLSPMPTSLTDWHQVLVSLNPSAYVYPQSAPLEK